MKRDKFKFSIIVVSLNTKKDFIKTINSIIKQSFNNKEIIVVDGLSDDGTVYEIKRLKKNFSKIILEKDSGIYHAMNKGLRVASGEWIFFLNSGDLFKDRDVLKNASKLIKKKNDIVFGDCLINNGQIIYKNEGKPFTKNTILMPYSHQSVFVKKKLFFKNYFNLRYKISSDFDFFYCQFKKNRKFQKINIILSITKSGGISDKKRLTVLKENFDILKKNKITLFKFLKIFLYFIEFLLKRFIKFILPTFIIKIVLNIKYKDKIIKN